MLELGSDGTIKIYRGGADTVMCTGEAKIHDLVALCLGLVLAEPNGAAGVPVIAMDLWLLS